MKYKVGDRVRMRMLNKYDMRVGGTILAASWLYSTWVERDIPVYTVAWDTTLTGDLYNEDELAFVDPFRQLIYEALHEV